MYLFYEYYLQLADHQRVAVGLGDELIDEVARELSVIKTTLLVALASMKQVEFHADRFVRVFG